MLYVLVMLDPPEEMDKFCMHDPFIIQIVKLIFVYSEYVILFS